MHKFKCIKCNTVFTKDLPKEKKTFIVRQGKLVSEKGDYTPIVEKCPKCGGEAHKIISWIPTVWGDNLRPYAGYATVNKRHEYGIWHDQDPKKLKEAQNLNEEMRTENKKVAEKIAEEDEKKFIKEYHPVEAPNLKEALKVAKQGSYS